MQFTLSRHLVYLWTKSRKHIKTRKILCLYYTYNVNLHCKHIKSGNKQYLLIFVNQYVRHFPLFMCQQYKLGSRKGIHIRRV